jgi:hypothetical protein
MKSLAGRVAEERFARFKAPQISEKWRIVLCWFKSRARNHLNLEFSWAAA